MHNISNHGLGQILAIRSRHSDSNYSFYYHYKVLEIFIDLCKEGVRIFKMSKIEFSPSICVISWQIDRRKGWEGGV